MSNIKNIIFDIGNVILNFDYKKVVKQFTGNANEQKFILDNIINSPEWLGYALIDTGFITRESAITMVQDRTNHINDKLIYDFWMNYNDYASVNTKMLDIIRQLKENEYKIYLLSNINAHTAEFIQKTSNLFNIVDGYILSYQIHQVKPYESIYKSLIAKYSLNVEECIFIDDNQKNIDTGNKLGIMSLKVEPDNIESIKAVLSEYRGGM